MMFDFIVFEQLFQFRNDYINIVRIMNFSFFFTNNFRSKQYIDTFRNVFMGTLMGKILNTI